MGPFKKKYSSPEELTRLLKSRGLLITDSGRAEAYLRNIGYYRLSAYMLPFISIPKTDHQFKPGTTFDNVLDLYRFDKKLRVLLFIASVVGVLALMGVYRINSVNVNWIGLLLSFAAYSIVAVTEEVLFRGILFRMIDERYGALLAFIISSLTFGAVHLMTVDFWTAMAISAEAGFMLAAAYKFRNNLWIPIGIHWAWNFTLGPIFGVGVSGISEDAYAIIPEISGSYILTGGNNGFEGSIVTVLIGVAVGIVLYIYKRK